MREFVFLECSKCGERNYRASVQAKGERKKKLRLKKFCRRCRAHTVHAEKKK